MIESWMGAGESCIGAGWEQREELVVWSLNKTERKLNEAAAHVERVQLKNEWNQNCIENLARMKVEWRHSTVLYQKWMKAQAEWKCNENVNDDLVKK